MAASLKSRIDKLLNDLGAKPAPGTVDIRNRLSIFSRLAEDLESGQSAIEADQQIAVMQQTISELQSKLQLANAQSEQLQKVLDAARDKIREIEQQQEQNEDLSTIERQILYFFDRNGEAFEPGVARHIGKPAGSLDDMLDRLVADKFLHSKMEWEVSVKIYFLSKKGKSWLARDRERGP